MNERMERLFRKAGKNIIHTLKISEEWFSYLLTDKIRELYYSEDINILEVQ